MNITQIKQQIGQPVLTLSRSLDENKQPTKFVSHWDNEKRIRVSMHEEVFEKIKADVNFGGLALKKEVVTPKDPNKQPYIRYMVITPTNILATF